MVVNTWGRRVLTIAALTCLTVAGLAVPEAGAGTPTSSSRWTACTPRLAGVRTPVHKTQRTVTIVNGRTRTYANVSFWVRTDAGACTFTRKFATSTARVGYGGIVDGRTRRQSTGTTPAGTYSMTSAFGNGSKPATAMPWRTTRSRDYWVQDNKSRWYNEYRSSSQGGFRTSEAERLVSYGSQYRYVAVIDFNRARDPIAYKRNRGAGIFLHVKNSRATAGCVAVTKGQMETVLRWMRPGDRITIVR